MSTHWTRSEAETRDLGERLGRALRGGDVVLLCGDLGAGKTQLAKGVGRALGVRGEVVSPTFTFAVHYEGRLPLVHYDLYRVRTEAELLEIGFLDADDPQAVTLVEWGERVPQPDGAIRIDLHVQPDGSRKIVIGPSGPDLLSIEPEGLDPTEGGRGP